MDKFLETYYLSRQNQEEIKNLKKPIATNTSESVIKILPTKKSWTKWLHRFILSDFKRRININPSQSIPSNSTGRKAFKCILQADHYCYFKKSKGLYKNNYIMIFLMSLDAKILNQIYENQIQQYFTQIILHNQGEFISVLHGWFNIYKSVNVIYHVKTMKNKTYIVMSTDAEIEFDKFTILY